MFPSSADSAQATLKKVEAEGRATTTTQKPFLSSPSLPSSAQLGLTSDDSEGGGRVPKRGLVKFSQNFGLQDRDRSSLTQLPTLCLAAPQLLNSRAGLW